MLKTLGTMAAALMLMAAPMTAQADCGACGTEGAHAHGEKVAKADCDCSKEACESCESDVKKTSHSHHASAHKAYDLGDKVKNVSATHAVKGDSVDLKALAGENGAALIFWNQKCPYVVEAQERIGEFHKKYSEKGVPVIAIDAGVNNDHKTIAKYAEKQPFPVLVNDDSKIAAMFGATRTPEVFLLNKDMEVVYHGAFDNGKLQGENDKRESYLKQAVKAMLNGDKPAVKRTKAFGCSLKYADGVEAFPRQSAESGDDDKQSVS